MARALATAAVLLGSPARAWAGRHEALALHRAFTTEPRVLVDQAGDDSWFPRALAEHPDPNVREAGRALRAAARALAAAEGGGEEAAAASAAEHLSSAEAELRALKGRQLAPPPRSAPQAAGSLVQLGLGGAPEPRAGELLRRGRPSASSGWLAPNTEDVAAVSRWASRLAGGGGNGTAAAAEIRAEPGSAAAILLRHAAAARSASDGVDRDQQVLVHLQELLLQERASTSELQLTRDLVRNLAGDARRLENLQGMSLAQLEEQSRSREADNIVRYFLGLAKRAAEYVQSGAGFRAPRVLVLSCSYGDGHRSASEAVSSYLQTDGLSVQIVDTTNDPRFRTGITAALGISPTFLYNSLILRQQWYRLQNMWETLGLLVFGQIAQQCPSPGCNTPWKDHLRSVLLETRPDLLVTVYHMDLLPILEVAKDLGNLPVLHLATDMDVKMREVFGKKGPGPSYPRFLVGVPFYSKESQTTIQPLSMDRTFLSGYPVRSAFLQLSDPARVAAERAQIAPPGTKVILVMSGGGGQDVPWPELLASQGIGVPLHVVVVAGRDTAFARRLERALPSSAEFSGGRKVLQGAAHNVTVEVARDPANLGTDPYYVMADRLALLMDVADAVVTKPGGGTTAEIAYRGVPAVFDATPGLLHWEEFTVQVFERAGRGARFTDGDALPEVLKSALSRGRSTSLAEDPKQPGTVLDTGSRIREAARRLLETPCERCPLFPAAAAQ